MRDDLRERPAGRPWQGQAGTPETGDALVRPGPRRGTASGVHGLARASADRAGENRGGRTRRSHARAPAGARSVGSETLSAKTLANEALAAVAANGVGVVCLSAVRPFAVMQARYLAKRLRARVPGNEDSRRPVGPETPGGGRAPQPPKRAGGLGGGNACRGAPHRRVRWSIASPAAADRRAADENDTKRGLVESKGVNPLAVVVGFW